MQRNAKVTKELTDEELMELAGGFTLQTSQNGLLVVMYAIRPIINLTDLFKGLFK